MSSGLLVQLRDIQRRAARLSEELVDLLDDIQQLQQPGLFGDWILVEDEFLPFPEQELRPLWNLWSFSGLEEGPPPLPQCALSLALQRLSGLPGDIAERAERCFNAGFWAKIALDTHTPYSRLLDEEVEDRKHWVVFYRHSPRASRRVTTLADFQCALTVEGDSVWEGFRTWAELVIFCLGARCKVPPLERWTSLC